MKQNINMRALDWSYTEYSYDLQTMDQYGYAVLRACFEVLGAEVSWVDVPKIGNYKENPQMNNSYLRDRGILFESADGQSHFLTPARYQEQSQLILEKAQSGSTTSGTGQGQDEASKAVPSLNIMDRSYFEGGNVFIDGGTLFHMPSTPGGFYSNNRGFKGGLSDQVKPLGLKVVNLNLNLRGFALDETQEGHIKKKVLYHLDCFMSVLPDGRCVISDLQLLDHDSQEELISHFGSRLIDLGLGMGLGMGLGNHFAFQFEQQVLNIQSIVNPKTGKICLVTDQVSDDVILKLRKQTGCRVITPQTLDPGSRFYDKSFSQAVYRKLVDSGFDYKHEWAIHTGDHLPENDVLHYFPMHQGLLSQEQRDWELGRVQEKMDRSTQPIQFISGEAGVHCLVQETFIPNAKALQKKRQMIVLRNGVGALLCLGGASLAGAAYLTSAVTPLALIVSSVVLGVGFLIGVMCHALGSKETVPQTQSPDQVGQDVRGVNETVRSSSLRENLLKPETKNTGFGETESNENENRFTPGD